MKKFLVVTKKLNSQAALGLRPFSTYSKTFFFHQHIPGSLDLIISIPHGGTLSPTWIPNRRCLCGRSNHDTCPVVWVSDDCTIDLGLDVARAIKMYCGREPYIVINHLKRPKLDPNREIRIGASRSYEVLEAFRQYHQCIADTKATFKRGLLIDLHGRGKNDGVTQIGYGVKKEDLILEKFNVNQSTIRGLAKERPGEDLITGQYSFGDFMEQEGYVAVPSPYHPKPGTYLFDLNIATFATFILR